MRLEGRAISHPVSRVTAGGGVVSLRVGAGRIACTDVRLCKAYAWLWTSSASCATLLALARGSALHVCAVKTVRWNGPMVQMDQ